MAEDTRAEHDVSRPKQQIERHSPDVDSNLDQIPSRGDETAYSVSLLSDPRLDGRGNGPVRAALMRQIQRTYGNRAVQRGLASQGQSTHVSSGRQPIEHWAASRQERHAVRAVQRQVPVQRLKYEELSVMDKRE